MHEYTTKLLSDTGETGPEGLVGMPGLRGPSADRKPGETEEEHLQRWRDAADRNARLRTGFRRLFGDIKR